MAKPKNKATRTYVCQGRLNRGTNAHNVLMDRRIKAGILFDTAINTLDNDHQGKTLNGNQSQLLATIVANQLGVQRGHLDNRCRIATVQKAVNAWNNHVKHDHGLPRKYDGQPVKTIDTFANQHRFQKPLIKFTQKGNAKLLFPGLPPIRPVLLQATPRRPAHLRIRLRNRPKGQSIPSLPAGSETPPKRR